MSVTAHLVVNFANTNSVGDNASISAEVDTRPDGLNDGQSEFLPGSQVYLLAYTNQAEIDLVEASAGSVVYHSDLLIPQEQTLQFANEQQASLSKPYHSDMSVTWLGNSLGILTPSGTRVTASISGVGVARVTYNTLAKVYRLLSPPTVSGLRDFDILVVFTGHST